MLGFSSHLARINSCLIEAADPHRRWLGKMTVWVAWLGLLAAAISPPHGTGFTVCWLKAATGLSCPGCGLTRSLSCGLRGMFAESWHYHPLGLPILLLFLIAASSSLLPAAGQARLAAYMRTHSLFFNSAYVLFVISFLAFGFSRMLLELPHLW
jgi:hypothetical protein